MKGIKTLAIGGLAVALLGCSGNGVTTFNSVIDGVLSSGDPQANGHYYDTYTFVANESGSKAFGMTSDEVDSYLVLEDENGDVVREDDDSGEGRDAEIRYFLNNNETYYLLATSYGTNDQGNYSVGWQDGVDLVDVGRSGRPSGAKGEFKVKAKN